MSRKSQKTAGPPDPQIEGQSPEFKAFEKAVKKVLSVPKEEVEKRLAQEKEQRKKQSS